ncbi:hypothetical protein [Aeromicrobium sp. UC242_57]
MGTPHDFAADGSDGEDVDDLDGIDPRVVTIKPHGPRWIGVPLRSTLLR